MDVTIAHPTIVDFENYCKRQFPDVRLKYDDGLSDDPNTCRTFKSRRVEDLWLAFSAGWDCGWSAADVGEFPALPNPVSIWQDFFDEANNAEEIIKRMRGELARVQKMRSMVLDWATDQEREDRLAAESKGGE